MSVTTRDKQWYELPRPAAMKNLIEVRDELERLFFVGGHAISCGPHFTSE